MLNSGISVLLEGTNMLRLLIGLAMTLKIAFISVAICCVTGILAGMLMNSRYRIIQFVMRFYLETVRIVPILVWLFVVFFGLTRLWGIDLGGQFVSVLIFSIWGTAEMGDIVRGAIQSLPAHQRQSGAALGLTELQIYRYIIIPQTVRRILPAAINLVTRMIKTTSLVVFVGVIEVVKVGQQIIEFSVSQHPTVAFWIYGLIFLFYFFICYPISVLSKRLELKWAD